MHNSSLYRNSRWFLTKSYFSQERSCRQTLFLPPFNLFSNKYKKYISDQGGQQILRDALLESKWSRDGRDERKEIAYSEDRHSWFWKMFVKAALRHGRKILKRVDVSMPHVFFRICLQKEIALILVRPLKTEHALILVNIVKEIIYFF